MPARWLDVVIGCCVGALFAAAMLVVGTVEARRRAKQRATDRRSTAPGLREFLVPASGKCSPSLQTTAAGLNELSSTAEVVGMGSGGTQAVAYELSA